VYGELKKNVEMRSTTKNGHVYAFDRGSGPSRIAISRARVLIVEDNVKYAAALGDALGDRGISSALAVNAEIALDLIRSTAPGTYPVVMLDNHLGTGMTGIDLMHRLRDDELLNHVAGVIWISTDTEVAGLWSFPDLIHNVEYGGNDTTVEQLAGMAARLIRPPIVRSPVVCRKPQAGGGAKTRLTA